jgi:hypothetical protein
LYRRYRTYQIIKCSRTEARIIVNDDNNNLKQAGTLVPDEVMMTMLAFGRGKTANAAESIDKLFSSGLFSLILPHTTP